MAPSTIATYDVACQDCRHEWTEHDLNCEGVLQSTLSVCPKCGSPAVGFAKTGRFLVHIGREVYNRLVAASIVSS